VLLWEIQHLDSKGNWITTLGIEGDISQFLPLFVSECVIMVALCNRADHINFHPVVCSFISFFLSLPNLSGRRLDVCHTSTHGVALVQI